MCDSSADIHSCEFVVWICYVPPQKKDLTEKILCGNLWANSLLWNKVEFEFLCAFGMKEESIFTIGRIANKIQFLRLNRCAAAERTTQFGRRPLGTPVGRNGSQQRFPAERLFWKQYIGLQDAGWPQEKIAAVKVNRRKMSGFAAKTVYFSALQQWKYLL